MDISDVTDAKIAKACTPNEGSSDRPAMKDVKATLDELKAMPESDREGLRAAYAAEF